MMRFLAYFFAACFVLSAIVQYNDPDPLIWVPIYLVPAFVSILFVRKRFAPSAYLVLGVIYLALAIYQWPPEFEGFLFGEVQKMRNMNIELARESFGLGIVAVAMFLFWLVAKKQVVPA